MMHFVQTNDLIDGDIIVFTKPEAAFVITDEEDLRHAIICEVRAVENAYSDEHRLAREEELIDFIAWHRGKSYDIESSILADRKWPVLHGAIDDYLRDRTAENLRRVGDELVAVRAKSEGDCEFLRSFSKELNRLYGEHGWFDFNKSDIEWSIVCAAEDAVLVSDFRGYIVESAADLIERSRNFRDAADDGEADIG